MAENKERIKRIKERFKVVDCEIGDKKFQAVEGISTEEIEWVVERLYKLEVEE